MKYSIETLELDPPKENKVLFAGIMAVMESWLLKKKTKKMGVDLGLFQLLRARLRGDGWFQGKKSATSLYLFLMVLYPGTPFLWSGSALGMYEGDEFSQLCCGAAP